MTKSSIIHKVASFVAWKCNQISNMAEDTWPLPSLSNSRNSFSIDHNEWRKQGKKQCPWKILGIIGQDPTVSKSNWLHVDIFRFFLYYLEAYSIDSSKMTSKFPKVLNFDQLFLKLNRFMSSQFSSFIGNKS